MSKTTENDLFFSYFYHLLRAEPIVIPHYLVQQHTNNQVNLITELILTSVRVDKKNRKLFFQKF
jgi:hypothetical protein